MSQARLKRVLATVRALWEIAEKDPGVAASVADGFARIAAEEERKAAKFREIEGAFAELHREHVRRASRCGGI